MMSNLKMLRLLTVCCLCAAMLLTGPAYAQSEDGVQPAPSPAPSKTRALSSNQLVAIDFNNVDIAVFIKFISELTGKNFVINQRVKGKVTIISPGKITVAEAYKVFESVLEVHGYAAVPAGEIIKIIPSPEARTKSIKTRLEEEAGSTSDTVVTQIIPLRYASPTDIKRLFTPLVSKSSVILAYAPTNTLIVTDVASNIRRLMRILKAIDITGVGQQIAVIPVEYADAKELVTLLNSVFKSSRKTRKGQTAGQQVTFVADDRTNTIVILASEADTARIRRLVGVLDKQTPKGKAKIHVYYLENATAEELVKVLQDLPQKQSGQTAKGKKVAPVISEKVRITADKATNSLVIVANQKDYKVLEDIIQKVDIPRSMVYIEALIMEVNVDKDFRLGTEWITGGTATTNSGKQGVVGGGFSGGALGGDTGYTFSSPTGALLPPGFGLGMFGEQITIGGITFPTVAAVIQAYKKDKDVHILSTPQILTTDNEEAKIYVGKNIPFQTKSTTTSNDTFNSFEYRDVGKTLKITPHISKDRMVRLELSLEVTDLESTTDFRPTTLKRTVETTAIVKDRNTVVLGGLIDDSFSAIEYKVPCLGDIPGFGLLFRSTGKADVKTNLYIFLTPKVIQNTEEAASVAKVKRKQIDDLRETKIKLYHDDQEEQPADLPPARDTSSAPAPADAPEPDDTTASAGATELPPPAETSATDSPVTPSSDTGVTEKPALPEPAAESAAAPTDQSKTPAVPENSPTSTPARADTPADQPAHPAPPPVAGADAPAGDNPDVSSSKPASPKPASTPQGFTIQAASVRNAKVADQMLQQLNQRGYAAYTVRFKVDGKTWYRLRIGYFDTRKEAAEVMKRLEKDRYHPILIRL